MKNLLKFGCIAFCFVLSTLAYQARASGSGAANVHCPGQTPAGNDHNVVFTYHENVHFAINDYVVLPGRVADVPKTKVMILSMYFGMLVGADISHRFAAAKIVFTKPDYGFFIDYPPKLITA